MQVKIFYIFQPTSALCELTASANEMDIAQPCVWCVIEHDRVGSEYQREELERAHWAQFVANLFPDQETIKSLELRSKCLEMGFHGCWSTLKTKVGGDAKELMEESERAHNFLAEHGIVA